MDINQVVPDKMQVRKSMSKLLREVRILRAILKAIEKFERESAISERSNGVTNDPV